MPARRFWTVSAWALVLIQASTLTALQPTSSSAAFGQEASSADSPVVVAAGLDTPRSVSLAADGVIYVADSGDKSTAGRVLRIGLDQPILPLLESIENAPGVETNIDYVDGVAGLASDGASLYVVLGAGAWLQEPVLVAPNWLIRWTADSGVDRLFDFAATEQARALAEHRDPDSNGASVAVAPGGSLWVSDAAGNWVARLSNDLHSAEIVVPFAQVDAQDAVPTGLAVGPDNAVYVALFRCQTPTTEKGAIVRIASDGQSELAAAGFSNPIGVAFDDAGGMYVLEFGVDYAPHSGDVIRVAPDGERTTVISGLDFPTSLAIDNAGNLYITQIGSLDTKHSGELLRMTLPSH